MKITVYQAKEVLRRNGYYVENLWQVVDVQEKYNCTHEEAMEVLDNAFENSATYDQIWMAIDFAADYYGLVAIECEEEEEEISEEQKFEALLTDTVVTLIKKEYLTSEVVSGEFILSMEIPKQINGEDVPKKVAERAVREFLDWDESTTNFEIDEDEIPVWRVNEKP